MSIREMTVYLHTHKTWAAKKGKQIHTTDTDRLLSLKQDVLTTSSVYSDATFSVEDQRKITQDQRVHLPGTPSQNLWDH